MNEQNDHPVGDTLFGVLIAVAADGIIVIDEDGSIRVYNEACRRLFGYAPDEVVGADIAMLMPEPYRSAHASYIARYRKTGERHIIGIGREAVGQHKDGTTFPMYISVGEGVQDGKRIFVGIVHDISERKARERYIEELQRDLRHATRLSAMGQLSSAIAHELNQPLAAGLNYANAAHRYLEDISGPAAERAREASAKAASQIGRAGDIIRRLREFVEKREPARVLTDINRTVSDAVALGLIGTVGADIPCTIALADGLPRVLADRVQIQQVVVNLLLNAADAVQGLPVPRLHVETTAEGVGAVRVAVVDNGSGLSEEARRSLFQPFATTKPTGMGMGLSICRTIVEAHGGRLWVEQSPFGGTIFQFTLPVSDDPDAS